MAFLGAVAAGLVGTAVMTALIYMMPLMGLPKMDIIGMLGTMFTADEGTANIVGTVVHFLLGIIFAIIYAFLWDSVIGDPTALWGLAFGLVHGIIAVIVMPTMRNMHPRPPEMEMGPLLMAGLIVGHIIFGIVVALVYAAFI